MQHTTHTYMLYIYIYIYTYIYIYIYIHTQHIFFLVRRKARGVSRRPSLARAQYIIPEFRDVVFEDVVFDNHRFDIDVTLKHNI